MVLTNWKSQVITSYFDIFDYFVEHVAGHSYLQPHYRLVVVNFCQICLTHPLKMYISLPKRMLQPVSTLIGSYPNVEWLRIMINGTGYLFQSACWVRQQECWLPLMFALTQARGGSYMTCWESYGSGGRRIRRHHVTRCPGRSLIPWLVIFLMIVNCYAPLLRVINTS